ncbi:MAG: hypothetical protein EAZ27_03265 [Cytophagales bacterium]|nr:MAG: hypothetical protein EAZ27_03265 [Cytophagales bacterium]
MKSIIVLIFSLIYQFSNANSYFSILPSKKVVKIGEKFTLSVKFYYCYDSLEFSKGISYKFYNVSEDFKALLPKIHPNNCIIVNRQIEEILNSGNEIINNKTYTVYEMVFMECYPIKIGRQKFNSFSLRLQKKNKLDSNIIYYKSKEFELNFIKNNKIGSIDGTNLASGDFKILEEDSIFLENENRFSVFLEGYGNYFFLPYYIKQEFN